MSSDGMSQTHGNDIDEPQPLGSEPVSASKGTVTGIAFWPAAWAGTTLAGCLFGLILGGPAGLFGGAIIAGLLAFVFQIAAAFLTWALWLFRFRTVIATIAGGLTGVFATWLVFQDECPYRYKPALAGMIAGAGLLGAIGGGLGGFLWHMTLAQHGVSGAALDRRHRVITPSTILGHLAALITGAIMVAMVVAAVIEARHASRRRHCANQVKQIWLGLSMYESAHKSLPPAYLSDAAGKPVLSWRVCIAKYYWYNLDFSEHVDSSQPWDSPKNAKFLSKLHGFYRCPAVDESRDNRLTDYVAVVGPGTIWSGKEPRRLPEKTDGKTGHRSPIMVVEWPRSDIHWAEPRDITVEEFLDWFRSKHGRGDGNHPGCLMYVDAQGDVGTLRNDTDPEEVRRMLLGEDVAN